MAVKVGIISLGCAKNRIDTEQIISQIQPDCEFVPEMSDADIVIINTCAFINDAKEESINAILEAEQQKKFGDLQGIIVTGCLSERYRDELKELMPNVDAFLGTAAYKDIKEAFNTVASGGTFERYADQKIDEAYGERHITTAKPTAYVKIAEGCDNHCTFCVIPSVRGRYQSRDPESIVKEVEALAADGYYEIILVAQDTTAYGHDLDEDINLAKLLARIAQVPGVKWLRFLYGYPDGITDELLEVMTKHENIVEYIDIPIQHTDDEILKKMNRRNDFESIKNVIRKIRGASPDFIIRSTIIVGFPGEKKQNFLKLYKDVQELKLDRLGVFVYSKEENTPAADMEDHVNSEEAVFRRNDLMNVQASISFDLNQKRIDRTYKVLIEGYDKNSGRYYGRSYAEVPEADGNIWIITDEPLEVGETYDIKITTAYNYDLIGELDR